MVSKCFSYALKICENRILGLFIIVYTTLKVFIRKVSYGTF